MATSSRPRQTRCEAGTQSQGSRTSARRPSHRRSQSVRPRIAPWRWLRSAAPLAATALALVMPAAATAAEGPEAGTVRFMKGAESMFDPFTRDPSPDTAQWMRDHYARMRTYASYFDTRTSWYPNAWTYKDAYAIYPGTALASGADRFILRDGAGSKLYIPFACSGGTCPQYAADIGDPEFRAAWLEEARSQMSHGYRGLYVDDVNTYLQVCDGTGANVAPVDPRTGATMTWDAWKRYMADFMVEIRAAFPDREVVHNPVWFAGDSDPQVRRAMEAADVINVERGMNDGGLTGGTGQFALRTLLAYVDHRHAEGHGVVWDSEAPTDAARLYGLAGYFLTSNGKDYLGTHTGGTPADWWKGYDVQLGAPLAGRYDWNGVIRRDFAGGFVLLNVPGSPAQTLTLPSGAIDLDGVAQSSVTLAP